MSIHNHTTTSSTTTTTTAAQKPPKTPLPPPSSTPSSSSSPSASTTPWTPSPARPGTPAILPVHNGQVTTVRARGESAGGGGIASGGGTGRGGTGGEEDEGRGKKEKWWRVDFFKGMLEDVRRRAPFYVSDWVDAWDYRVVPATVYMYFANILPALAFSLDMFTKTNMSYGVNEVLLASVLGAVVFAIFAAQPLVIVGVTGPITVFNYTVYDIITPTGTNFFSFMCWIGLWSMVMHWILAISNACNALKYVTRFPCDIFGFYVAFIYLQKGIQVLTNQGSDSPFYLSVMVALLVLGFGYLCGVIGTSSLFQHYVRTFIKDYGTSLTVIFFTGFVHFGRMSGVSLKTLPTTTSFSPTLDRGWLIHFWDIRVADVFIAFPFAVLLTILFYFDHNVSSLIAQGTEFPLRKPAGFHWDLFLLGITTGIAGLLGIPAPNGLIPQAPFHTEALCVTKLIPDLDEDRGNKGHVVTKIDHVVEQRVSNLAQGLLTLGTMSGPLLVVLHLIPQGVLAGLFFVMGIQALEGNGIAAKLLFLARDKTLTTGSEPLKLVHRRSAIWWFVAIQLLGFGATFAITQTVAAVGFPIIILLLIPVRTYLLPVWFTEEELSLLDAPTASPFTMISVGGNFGQNSTILDPSRTGTPSLSPSTREGLFVQGEGSDGEEVLIERGEGPGTGMQRRGSRRSGRRDDVAFGDAFEMRHIPSARRRSANRQQR